MTAYNSVFKRVEKKYRIDVAERAAVEAAAERLMAVDDYGRTRITSLYLDTPERAMIARSVEKPLYKEKLRLRAYGDAAGVALMGAFGAGPIVREPGGLPLSDGEVETRVAAGLRVARTAAGLQVAPAAAGLQTMGDADGDAVGSVEACRPCAGEALRGNGLSAGFPVFFGIKKKFKGIVYKRAARPDAAGGAGLRERLALRAGLCPLAAAGCGACGRGARAGHAPDRPRARGGHEPLAAPGALHGHRLRSCGLGLSARGTRGAWVRRAARRRAAHHLRRLLGVFRLSLLPFAMAAHHRVERVRHGDKERRALPAVAGGRAVGRADLPGFIYQVWQRLSDGNGCAARSKSSKGYAWWCVNRSGNASPGNRRKNGVVRHGLSFKVLQRRKSDSI